MPGVDHFSNGVEKPEAFAPMPSIDTFKETQHRSVYYNPRLDPKNYLEGPLSPNPATRLRQMLARPGIVVGFSIFSKRTRSDNIFQKVAPGVCDGISARCALEAGFTCMYQRYGFQDGSYMLLA